jgi:hypothetical protein
MARTKGATGKSAREKRMESEFAKKEAMYKRRIEKRDKLIDALRKKGK